MKHSKSSLIAKLQQTFAIDSKIPYVTDPRLPNYTVFKYHFGNFKNAVHAAGLVNHTTKTCLQCEQLFIPNSRKQQFCSRSCSATHNNLKRPSKRPPSKSQFEKGLERFNNGLAKCYQTHRKYLSHTRGYRCEICSIDSWLGQPLTLEVDHIDGNPDNNFPSNLRLLCLHCHSQTPTYRVRNRNNFKSDRRSLSRRRRYYGNGSG